MSTPLVERIAVNLEKAINAITVANGFNYDLTAVRPKRLHLEGDINKDLTVIIEQESPSAEPVITDETITWHQPFTLQAIVIDSDKATEAIDTRLNKIRADIEKQLNSEAYRDCEGLAEGIFLKQPEKFTTAELSAIAVNIDVQYTTDYDDPCMPSSSSRSSSSSSSRSSSSSYEGA